MGKGLLLTPKPDGRDIDAQPIGWLATGGVRRCQRLDELGIRQVVQDHADVRRPLRNEL
jgi:hypothetical protein